MGSTQFAGQTITVRRSAAIRHLLSRNGFIPTQRNWRKHDPPDTTVGQLGPDDFHKRVVIRSGEFLGTVYGTLLDVQPHPNLVHFTTVQLYGKKLLTFRDDMEAIVVDDLHSQR